jgi:magnesium-transporting ATPase (P-type)
MGILLRHKKSETFHFYLKGADLVMEAKIKQVYRGFMADECEMMANDGLRTLGKPNKTSICTQINRP